MMLVLFKLLKQLIPQTIVKCQWVPLRSLVGGQKRTSSDPEYQIFRVGCPTNTYERNVVNDINKTIQGN
jgi:hypothetical protein